MDWIHLARDRDQLGGGAFVNTVMNLEFHKRRRISCLAD
jgi:hypothetical protein